MHCSTKSRDVCGAFGKPVGCHIDYVDGAVVAVLGRIAPCEKPVALQNNPFGIRVVLAELFQPETEFVTGAFPRQPPDTITKDLLRQIA